jgi:hypothetical protein
MPAETIQPRYYKGHRYKIHTGQNMGQGLGRQSYSGIMAIITSPVRMGKKYLKMTRRGDWLSN